MFSTPGRAVEPKEKNKQHSIPRRVLSMSGGLRAPKGDAWEEQAAQPAGAALTSPFTASKAAATTTGGTGSHLSPCKLESALSQCAHLDRQPDAVKRHSFADQTCQGQGSCRQIEQSTAGTSPGQTAAVLVIIAVLQTTAGLLTSRLSSTQMLQSVTHIAQTSARLLGCGYQ